MSHRSNNRNEQLKENLRTRLGKMAYNRLVNDTIELAKIEKNLLAGENNLKDLLKSNRYSELNFKVTMPDEEGINCNASREGNLYLISLMSPENLDSSIARRFLKIVPPSYNSRLEDLVESGMNKKEAIKKTQKEMKKVLIEHLFQQKVKKSNLGLPIIPTTFHKDGYVVSNCFSYGKPLQEYFKESSVYNDFLIDSVTESINEVIRTNLKTIGKFEKLENLLDFYKNMELKERLLGFKSAFSGSSLDTKHMGVFDSSNYQASTEKILEAFGSSKSKVYEDVDEVKSFYEDLKNNMIEISKKLDLQPKGVVHNDYHKGNVFVNKGKDGRPEIYIHDWEKTGLGTFHWDFAFMMDSSALCFPGVEGPQRSRYETRRNKIYESAYKTYVDNYEKFVNPDLDLKFEDFKRQLDYAQLCKSMMLYMEYSKPTLKQNFSNADYLIDGKKEEIKYYSKRLVENER